MATKEGLRFSDLSDRQWDYAAPILMDRLEGMSIADGFITNWQQDAAPGEQWHFEVMVVGDDRQQHALGLTIPHYSKEDLAPIIEAQVKAREAIKKLEQEGESAQSDAK